jgi:alpha-1,2-mannosyltransferase
MNGYQNIKTAYLGLLCLYIPLCYFALHQEWGLDFASYYAASYSVLHGSTPYVGVLSHTIFSQTWNVPVNPNPPFTLGLFSVFSAWGYLYAFYAWLIFSTCLGILGAYKTLQVFCPKLLTEKESALFLLMYFSAYPILMNTIMLQFGGCMLFCLIMGYEAYLKQNDRLAGFWWGGLIALKLFPGLLVFYACLKKRYALVGWIVGWTLLLSLLPILFLGKSMYLSYFQAVAFKIYWYGVNWNMSILGFLSRVFVPVIENPVTKIYDPVQGVFAVNCAYAIVVTVLLASWGYFFKRLDKIEARGFSCVIVLMMLLSPLGWFYFMPMLLIPLICTLNDAVGSAELLPKRLGIWFVCVFCFYLPMPVIHAV